MQSLPTDVLHIIADRLPIRSVARMMTINKQMYARKESVLCRALMRNRPMTYGTPVIIPASPVSAKIAFVQKTARGLAVVALSAILKTLTSGQPSKTPALKGGTRYKVHVLCDQIGLKSPSGDYTKAKTYLKGCECCGDYGCVKYRPITITL